MKQSIILLSANPYSIADEKTGRVNEGVSITYLPNGSLNPVENEPAKGVKAAKGNLPAALFGNIIHAPAFYEAEIIIAVDKDGRPAIKVEDLSYVGCIDAQLVKGDAKASAKN